MKPPVSLHISIPQSIGDNGLSINPPSSSNGTGPSSATSHTSSKSSLSSAVAMPPPLPSPRFPSLQGVGVSIFTTTPCHHK